jgi:hypothetical protein
MVSWVPRPDKMVHGAPKQGELETELDGSVAP